jgi:hypothetical protein
MHNVVGFVFVLQIAFTHTHFIHKFEGVLNIHFIIHCWRRVERTKEVSYTTVIKENCKN